MTARLIRSGGPSDLHEARAATLSTLATLTGHLHHLNALPDGSRPDVLQFRPSDGSLFIGDAKATETPGNQETYLRLSNYADSLAQWVRFGSTGVLALVVAEVDAYGWLRVLRGLAAAPSGGVRVPGHLDVIEEGTAVVWQDFVVRATKRVGRM